MLPQNQQIYDYLAKQPRSPYLDEVLRSRFLKRLEENRPITKIENETDHICTFALPYDKKTNTVFLGHHKKANSWIPPGGHLDPGEDLVQTVIRECQEELKLTITGKNVHFYTITLIDIVGFPRCTRHYDFWHIIEVPQQEFTIEAREFYDSAWIPVEDAYKRGKHPQFVAGLKQLPAFVKTHF